MLQWMGGSRRKVTSSRKSIHNRQKQYFEQRKRQQQVPGLENLSDARKQAHYHEETRSLDIISLINLATVSQQELDVSQVDSHFSQFAPENVLKAVTSRFPEDFEKSCSKPGSIILAKTAAANSLQDVPIPHGTSSKIDKLNLQASPCEYTSNIINKSSRQEAAAQTDNFSEVSVLDILGDDGPRSISDGGSVPEAHVAFSVEGLGKVGIGTPAHSPRRYDSLVLALCDSVLDGDQVDNLIKFCPTKDEMELLKVEHSVYLSFDTCEELLHMYLRRFYKRNLHSPPKAPRRIKFSGKQKSCKYDIGIKMNDLMQDIQQEQDGCPLESLWNTRDIFDDQFSNVKSSGFTFSCTSPDAYDSKNQKFNNEEESFYMEGQKPQPWSVAASVTIDDNLLSDKSGVGWKNKPAQTESFSPFTFKAKTYNSSDYEIRDTFSPRSRTLFREDKRAKVSASSTKYFRDLTSENEYNPLSFDRERHHSCNEMSSPDSMFCPPDWSLLGMEDSQDSMTLLSEESCSSAAVRDERSNHLGSHSVLRKGKIKHTDQSQKHSRKKYDSEEFSADQTDHARLEKFLQEERAGNYKNMTHQWDSKASRFSKDYTAFHDKLEPHCVSLGKEKFTSAAVASPPGSCHRTLMETDSRSFNHKLMSEDDLFDSFPVAEPYPITKSINGGSKSKTTMKNEPSMTFINEIEILMQFSGADVQLPAAFPWDTEDHFSFVTDYDKDPKFPGLSKQQDVCEDSEVEYRRTPERPLHKDRSEKNSLSSNGRTADVADNMKHGSENVELKDEKQEVFDGPETRDPSIGTEEEPRAMEEIPSQFESCIDDKLSHHFGSHAPVPSQVTNKDSVRATWESEGINVGSMGGSKGDASFQVMLESYVLQLLCVQNVLLEASEKDIKR